MKKLSTILVLFCAVVVSVLFSACGDKYKNLSISFIGNEDAVILVMDEEYQATKSESENNTGNKKVAVVGFSFSGIKASDIGEINIQIVPSDLALVNGTQKDGNDFYARIVATRSGNGNIVVTHVATGKNLSILLHVDKKGVFANSKGYSLVVGIPEQKQLSEEEKADLTSEEIAQKESLLNQKIFTIDPNSLLEFNPIEATDTVDWKIVDENGQDARLDLDGVQFGSFDEFGEELKGNDKIINNQIKVSSTSSVGSFYLKPILKMDGYNDIVTDVVLRVDIAKVLDKNNISIISPDAVGKNFSDSQVKGFKVVENGIKLFSNSSEYKDAQLALFNGDISLLNSEEYLKLYDIQVNKSCSQIAVEDSKVDTVVTKTVVGLNFSANKEWIEFCFKPKKAVGDIQEFSIRLEIELSEVATSIGIKEDGKKLDPYIDDGQMKIDIDLLDYYSKYNNIGERFNFEVLKSSTDSSLTKMRIVVAKDLLSKKNFADNTPDGKYVFEFRRGSQYLSFSESEDKKTFISDVISSFENIYVKYSANESGNDDKNLSFSLTNFYDGTYGENALEGTEKSLEIIVNKKRGVKSLELKGANLTYADLTYTHKVSTSEEFYVLNSALPTSDDVGNGIKEWIESGNKIAYGVSVENIIGDTALTDDEKSDIRFVFEIMNSQGQNVDYFDLYRYYNASFDRIVGNVFQLKLSNPKEQFNSINFVKKANVNVPDGEYTFVIRQELSGYSNSYKINIVSNVNANNLKITPFDDKLNIYGVYHNNYKLLDKKPDNWESNYFDYYKYDEYTQTYTNWTEASTDTDIKIYELNYADYLANTYIVPTNKEISTNIMAGDFDGGQFVENSDLYQYISSISVLTTWLDSDGNVAGIEGKIENYIGYSPDIVSLACRTGKFSTRSLGTVLDGSKYYIKLDFVVKCKAFRLDGDGFYALKDDLNEQRMSLNFFVYVPIDRAYINNNVSTTTCYIDNDNLGYYYKSLSKMDFVLNVPNPNETSQSMFDYINYEWIKGENLNSNTIKENGRTLNVHFTNGNVVTIVARVTQFNYQRNVVCQVVLREPTNTKDIAVRNNLKTLNDSKYVNLKLGDSFKFNVDILGENGFSEIKYVVCDNVGNISQNYYIDANGNIVNKDNRYTLDVAQDLKVLIFAKDWIYRDVDGVANVFDFNDLSEYLIHQQYKSKVKIVEVKIRNGSKTQPFMLSDASELRAIVNDNGEYYYQLTNDINMSNIAINLGNFAGHLNSYWEYQLLTAKPSDWASNYGQYFVYTSSDGYVKNEDGNWAYRKFYKLDQSHFTIYNVTLGTRDDNDSFNRKYGQSYNLDTNVVYMALFDSLLSNASIENVTFAVSFSSTNITSDVKYVGVIGENLGSLKNVAVELNGHIDIAVAGKTIFIGGLVGKNSGTIKNSDINYVYCSGSLSVEGDKQTKIYLGGLVGLNCGTIQGVLPSAEKGIEYAFVYEEQGALFNADLSLTNVLKTELVESEWKYNSALGGVAGVNLDGAFSSHEGEGKIIDTYSAGKLTGEDVVGGLAGLNIGQAKTVNNSDSNTNITNSNITGSLSTTKVVGQKYVGGLVGFDLKGSIYESKYEVYNTYINALGGTSIKGQNFVGGLVGYALDSQISKAYFHSFRWMYSFDEAIYSESEFYFNGEEKAPDILAERYVGGLVGYAYNYTESVNISMVVVDAFIKANSDSAGIVGYSYNSLVIGGAYVRGMLLFDEEAKYNDVRIWEGSIEQEADSFIHQIYSKDSNYEIKLLEAKLSEDKSSLGNMITKAPTNLDLSQSVAPNQKVHGTTEFLKSDGNSADTLPKTIMLYYYDLSNKTATNYANDYKTINTISLNDFINKSKIGVVPNDIGVRLKLTSSDSSVLTILQNGSIRLNHEGVAVIRFSSVINPNIYDEITVVVRSAPIDYEIYNSSTITEENKLSDQELIIIKGASKYVYESYTGTIIVNNTEYNYKYTSEVCVKVTNNNDAISINGKNGNLEINNQDAIIVTANERTADKIEVTLHPYIKFELGGETYLVRLKNDKDKKFNVITRQGASAINLDVTDAVISVGDEMEISFEIATDTKIEELDLSIVVKDQDGNVITPKDINENIVDKYDLFNLYVNNVPQISDQKLTLNGNLNDNRQEENFLLKVNQNLKVEEDLYLTIKFMVQDQYVVMNLVIIPQKITSIVANNFKDDGGWSTSSIIRPGKPNVIVIDVAPDIAQYDYLEITDTYSEEKIGFIQLDKFSSNQTGLEDSKALEQLDSISSDGFGIKLKKQADDKRFYVYTLLDQLAEISTTHRIKITVFSSSGYVLGETYINLEATTYPSVILTYINAKGVNDGKADSRLSAEIERDLAFGVEAKISARTINVEGDIKWTIDTTYNNSDKNKVLSALSIEQKSDGNYYLLQNMTKLSDYSSVLLGKSIIVTAKVQKMTNGHKEESSATIKFVIRKFVVNGVSLKSDIATSQNRVGGVTNRVSSFDFYFNRTDISYYDIAYGYWNTEYYYDSAITTDVNTLLSNINSLGSGVSIKLQHNYNNEEIDLTGTMKTIANSTDPDVSIIVKLSNNTQLIEFLQENGELCFKPLTSSLNNWSFKVELKLKYTGNAPTLVESGEESIVSSTFGINISEISTLFDYKPISNAQEFMDMVEGNYYILVDNIILTNYQLLDIKLGGFDGNGHTITVKSFDYNAMASSASDKVGYFGVFKEIYEDEIVKNLHVKYEIDSRDLCEYPVNVDNEYYESIYFGGIATKSNGIITNSIVEGTWNLSASQVSPSSFYVAGIVCENYGYITNTTSKVSINAGGLVGGIAIKNAKKISTTRFEGNISSYSNSALSNNIETAGFVLDNSGEIGESCVQNLTNGVVNLESAGSIGGFVYRNSGTIYDCCVSNVSFSSRGQVGGFVYSSTGNVARCYINSTESLQGDRSKDAFVFVKDSGTYADCFYILDSNVSSNVKGITCILRINMLDSSSYHNFIWTGDDYGVWKMTANGPVLTSAYTLIGSKSSVNTIVDGQEKVSYIVAGTKDIPYVIYSAETYEYYMSLAQDDVLYGYFRLVADIDLVSVRDNPISSQFTFSGILEGNNMLISNFGLYSVPGVTSIGLFKEIKSGIVNNLNISTIGIRASTANTVGTLAGIIDSSKIYNIKIDAGKSVVMGRNAVGGLAGIIKGRYSINGIISNVVASAIYRHTLEGKINIYNGKSVYLVDGQDNVDIVAYAGAVAGIVDGYDYQVVTNNYYSIKNVTVTGDVVLVGEIVGGAFGLVGENTLIDNVEFDVGSSSALKGVYYSGGIVGENRGIVKDATIVSDNDKYNLFDANMNGGYANVCGGVIAFNNGGLLQNAISEVNVISLNEMAVAGGIVARNVNGVIVNAEAKGGVYAYIAGGICGSDYGFEVVSKMEKRGAITSQTNISIAKAVKNYSTFDRIIGEERIQSIDFAGLKTWYQNEKEVLTAISKPISTMYYYEYSLAVESISLKYSRVLGAVIGMTDQYLMLDITGDNVLNVDFVDKKIFVEMDATVDADGIYFKQETNGDYYCGETRYKEEKIEYDATQEYTDYFKITQRRIANMTFMSNFNWHIGENDVRYNDLQELIASRGQTAQKLEYFYISGIVGETSGESFNSNNGYSNMSYLLVLD